MVIKDNLRAQYMVLDWHLINPRQSGFYWLFDTLVLLIPVDSSRLLIAIEYNIGEG